MKTFIKYLLIALTLVGSLYAYTQHVKELKKAEITTTTQPYSLDEIDMLVHARLFM